MSDDFKQLSHLLRHAFQQRRKTLRNNLKEWVSDSDFDAVGIAPTLRAEHVTPELYVQLSTYLLRTNAVIVSSQDEPWQMIRFENVHKWFKDLHVIDGVNLDIAKGEVVVVCGPSGSGKSTLIRTVNQLETIQEGNIYVDGVCVNENKTDLNKL